jgi:hypothetical protein
LACRHRAEADLQVIIDTGRGEGPMIDLRLRCATGGITDSVVMVKAEGMRGEIRE